MVSSNVRRSLSAYLAPTHPVAQLGLKMDMQDGYSTSTTDSMLAVMGPPLVQDENTNAAVSSSWAQHMVHSNPANGACWRHLKKVLDARAEVAA